MTDYLLDWCGLLVRWLHLVAGIAWIGSSFYFVWLDNHLEPVVGSAGRKSDGGAGPVHGSSGAEPVDTGVAGELWAVHGGGFYRSSKYRVAPPVLPPTLHWFYWEAYTTWLSGFGLLCLLYFLRAEAYLIDPSVLALSKPMAIAIAAGAIVASWLVYDGLCRSPLGSRPRPLAVAISLFTALEAWSLCQIFSGRGAFMIFGASLGTIMVANVLFIIIPGQRELVRAKREGREPDPAPGLKGKQRSVHNTYFTLPVLFVMMSNHYAMTYGARANWLVLLAMSFAGACIRGWFVARHKPEGRRGLKAALPAVLGGATLLVLVVVLAPATTSPAAVTPTVAAARIESIVQQRCVPCHSKAPTGKFGFTAPPNGVVLDTLEQLRARLPDIQKQVSMRAMPLGNLTGMTDEERSEVLMWIGHGARP